eukprot:351612-Chlamydomonas_euryale.AAC.20
MRSLCVNAFPTSNMPSCFPLTIDQCTVNDTVNMYHAGFQERDREGEKFVVAARPQRTRARGVAGDPEEIRRQRADTAAQAAEGSDEVDHTLAWDDDGEI